MRKKNWVEFKNNENVLHTPIKGAMNSISTSNKIKVFTKKGKNGKIITLVSGLNFKKKLEGRELLKRIKIFCSTGGTLDNNIFQFQGDMTNKIKEFLVKYGYLTHS